MAIKLTTNSKSILNLLVIVADDWGRCASLKVILPETIL